MSRYFTRKQPRAGWFETDWSSDDVIRAETPVVPDHVATETGILDAAGDMIMKAPRPIGFMRDDEW